MVIHSSQLAEVIQSLFISSGQTCDFCHGVLGTSTLQGPSTLWRGRAALQITASARRQRGGAGNSCRWPDGFLIRSWPFETAPLESHGQPQASTLSQFGTHPKGLPALDLNPKSLRLPEFILSQHTPYEEKNGKPQHGCFIAASPCLKKLGEPLPLWISLKMARIINAWEGLPTVGHCHPSGWPAACGPGLEPQVTGVPKAWGYPNSWMVYHGKSQSKMNDNCGYPNLWMVYKSLSWKILLKSMTGGYSHDLRNLHSWMIHSSDSRTFPPFFASSKALSSLANFWWKVWLSNTALAKGEPINREIMILGVYVSDSKNYL